MNKLFIPLLLLAALAPAVDARPKGGKSVYGRDNRLDLYAAPAEMRKLADSVVSLWKTKNLRYDDNAGTVELSTKSLAKAYKLCPGVQFAEQPVGAFCSGALVGADLVMTAGHCVKSEAACAEIKAAFGFAVREEGGGAPVSLPQSEVYSCKKIITRLLTGEPDSPAPLGQRFGPDYALIQLDRPVAGHKPLPIDRGQQLRNGDPVFVIGHPSMLPVKISGEASIRDASPQGYFVADLDTFGGNSGSPVFDANTNLIEGILVRGDEDFIMTPRGCQALAVYGQNGGRGEDVTKVALLERYIWSDPGSPGAALKACFKDMTVKEEKAEADTPPLRDSDISARLKGLTFW